MRIKGFDKNLCCRGMQFEVGKVYDTGAKDDEIRLCSNTVFHYCDDIRKVHLYYSCNQICKNRFCEIEALGAEVSDGDKIGSNRIKIVREIIGDELKNMMGMYNNNTGVFNTGFNNYGNYNTGNFNYGRENTGDYNSGIKNTGDNNSGDLNSGHNNSGDCNSGDCNTGRWNTGDCNSGSFNSGNFNIGRSNSGYWNKCKGSNGVFCNQEDRNIRIFNKPSGMSLKEFENSKYYIALISAPFKLTYWDEKEQYLRSRSYEEACAIWWENMKPENKEIIKSIPNFDPEVFFDITGIDLRSK